MSAYIPDYKVHTPKTLDEALERLAEEQGGLRPIAGGTDLMVLLESGALKPGCYLNILGLVELKEIRETNNGVEIGALCTYTDLLRHEALQRDYSLLCQAAKETGAITIQNRGTLGGNIANASPAADSPPALLVYDAELVLESHGKKRRVPYHQFHLGYKKMDLNPDELIAGIFLPKPSASWRTYYRKVGTRRAQSIAKVGLAARMKNAARLSDVRLALSSVAAMPTRALQTEAILEGKVLDEALIEEAVATLEGEISPIDDIRSTALYRMRVAGNLLREFLTA